MCVGGGTSNSLLAPSLSAGLLLSAGLSLSLSLSLSNTTHIYWNVVLFAFQTQYIQRLFVKKYYWYELANMYIVFHFRMGLLQLSSDFNTLGALISRNWIVHFRIKFSEKVFLSICCIRNRLRVIILWCNIICTIKWEIVLSGSTCRQVSNWVTEYTRVFGFTID